MGKKRGKFVKEGEPFVQLTVDFGDTESERLVRAPGPSATLVFPCSPTWCAKWVQEFLAKISPKNAGLISHTTCPLHKKDVSAKHTTPDLQHQPRSQNRYKWYEISGQLWLPPV